MNDLEKIIMDEISSLDEMRLIDVIGFIRYLKGHRPVKQELVTKWFEGALEEIRERKGEYGVTPASVNVKTKRRGRG